jgi:hypothetical protein
MLTLRGLLFLMMVNITRQDFNSFRQSVFKNFKTLLNVKRYVLK